MSKGPPFFISIKYAYIQRKCDIAHACAKNIAAFLAKHRNGVYLSPHRPPGGMRVAARVSAKAGDLRTDIPFPSSIMIKQIALILATLILTCSSSAAAPSWDIPQKVSQGRAFEVRITDTSPFRGNILWNGSSYPVPSSPYGGVHEARILLAMPIDAAKPMRAAADLSSGGLAASVTPLPVDWPRQILSVAPKYVSPPKKVLKRIERDRKLSREAIGTVTERGYWELPLHRPVPGTVSSVFGGRRVFNGQPRSPHLGTDLRGQAGTPVEAVASGTVVAASELYFSGNTIYIDHGQGVISMYCHLSSIGVRKGEFVGRGQVIGKVGATVRVTGPHLHSALYVGRIPVDILPLFEPVPSPVGGPSKEQPRN